MVGVCSPFLDIYECRSTGGVRRNIERFEGADFMVQLSWDEVAELSRTQIATLNKGRGFNIKYAPFAFPFFRIYPFSHISFIE